MTGVEVSDRFVGLSDRETFTQLLGSLKKSVNTACVVPLALSCLVNRLTHSICLGRRSCGMRAYVNSRELV